MRSTPRQLRDPVEPVHDGVFFVLPDALPRGRHHLTAEQVSEAQRERMLAAVTELLAAHGYRGFGVGEIATRAGVSLGTFYECFENKDACIFAGYDRSSRCCCRGWSPSICPRTIRPR